MQAVNEYEMIVYKKRNKINPNLYLSNLTNDRIIEILGISKSYFYKIKKIFNKQDYSVIAKILFPQVCKKSKIHAIMKEFKPKTCIYHNSNNSRKDLLIGREENYKACVCEKNEKERKEITKLEPETILSNKTSIFKTFTTYKNGKIKCIIKFYKRICLNEKVFLKLLNSNNFLIPNKKIHFKRLFDKLIFSNKKISVKVPIAIKSIFQLRQALSF